jgi:transposase
VPLHHLGALARSQVSYYFIHPKRGQKAMDAMDILPHFGDIGVHDGWASYAQYECEHSACNAHHLRDLIFMVERYQQPWAQDMIDLLLEEKQAVEEAIEIGKTTLAPAT